MTNPKAMAIKQVLASKDVVKEITNNMASHQTLRKMQAMAWSEVKNNPALLNCSPQSIAGAVITCAKLGLNPGAALGEAYFIPYGKECQLVIGYRGMINLARNSGQIKSISAHCVYAGDEFNFELGLDEKIIHRPSTTELPTAENVIAAYAVAKFKDGGHQLCVMYRNQIDKVKKNNQIWKDHYEEMAKKTAIRRLFKYLPISVEMIEANKLDDAYESDRSQKLDRAINGDKDDFIDAEEWEEAPQSNTDETLNLIKTEEVVNEQVHN